MTTISLTFLSPSLFIDGNGILPSPFDAPLIRTIFEPFFVDLTKDKLSVVIRFRTIHTWDDMRNFGHEFARFSGIVATWHQIGNGNLPPDTTRSEDIAMIVVNGATIDEFHLSVAI